MKIVYVTETPPWPITNGGVQRSNLLYRALSTLGNVKLVLWSETPLGADYKKFLEDRFGLVSVVSPVRVNRGTSIWHKIARTIRGPKPVMKLDPLFAREIANVVMPEDIVVARVLSVALRGGTNRFNNCFLDVDDLEYTKYQSWFSRGWKSIAYRPIALWHARWLRSFTPEAFRSFAGIWVANPKDRMFPGLENSVLLPNIPFGELGKSKSDFSDFQQVLLFVGYLGFRPNIHGLNHFTSKIWPRIRAALPHARFRIVGGGARRRDAARWNAVPGVELAGFVENLQHEYEKSAASVAPLYSGAGTNIKVLESLSMGTPTVVSSFALRGYEQLLKRGESLWVASDDKTMISNCIEALTDQDLGKRMAARGKEIVRSNFNYLTFERSVAELICTKLDKSKTLPRVELC